MALTENCFSGAHTVELRLMWRPCKTLSEDALGDKHSCHLRVKHLFIFFSGRESNGITELLSLRRLHLFARSDNEQSAGLPSQFMLC